MDEYFERVWAAVPDGARPEHFELRRDYLLSRVERGARVLDLGCGAGEFSGALAEAGAVPVGVDVAREPLRRAAAAWPDLEWVLAKDPLPFGGESFDVVWAGEVLEHVRDVMGLVDEAARLLRVGGRLVVSTPDHGRLLRLRLVAGGWERHFDPRGDHLRFFTAHSLGDVLELAGLVDIEIEARSGLLLAAGVRP